MPHFTEEGNESILCQSCLKQIDCGREKSFWRPDITGNESAATVCEQCASGREERPASEPYSLVEHCKKESGLTGRALRDYINRYYGHN